MGFNQMEWCIETRRALTLNVRCWLN